MEWPVLARAVRAFMQATGKEPCCRPHPCSTVSALPKLEGHTILHPVGHAGKLV